MNQGETPMKDRIPNLDTKKELKQPEVFFTDVPIDEHPIITKQPNGETLPELPNNNNSSVLNPNTDYVTPWCCFYHQVVATESNTGPVVSGGGDCCDWCSCECCEYCNSCGDAACDFMCGDCCVSVDGTTCGDCTDADGC